MTILCEHVYGLWSQCSAPSRADQAVKRLLLSGAVDLNGTMLIPGVANVTFAWNRGVSFNLLWQNSDLGSLLLIIALLVFVGLAAIIVWIADWTSGGERRATALDVLNRRPRRDQQGRV